MRGTVVNLYEGMLPLPNINFTPRPLMTAIEAHFWLWRVRTLLIDMEFVFNGETPEGQDPPAPIRHTRSVTVPVGQGSTGSRTEAQQLVSRRPFFSQGSPILQDPTNYQFTFGLYLFPQAPVQNLWYIGVGFAAGAIGLPFVSLGSNGGSLGDAYLVIDHHDPVTGEDFEHEVQLFVLPGWSGVVTITPTVFQTWEEDGLPLYDSNTGAQIGTP